MYEHNNHRFTKRLAALLVSDIAIAILDSFIPHELTPVRMAVGLIEFCLMAATMLITVNQVLEDF